MAKVQDLALKPDSPELPSAGDFAYAVNLLAGLPRNDWPPQQIGKEGYENPDGHLQDRPGAAEFHGQPGQPASRVVFPGLGQNRPPGHPQDGFHIGGHPMMTQAQYQMRWNEMVKHQQSFPPNGTEMPSQPPNHEGPRPTQMQAHPEMPHQMPHPQHPGQVRVQATPGYNTWQQQQAWGGGGERSPARGTHPDAQFMSQDPRQILPYGSPHHQQGHPEQYPGHPGQQPPYQDWRAGVPAGHWVHPHSLQHPHGGNPHQQVVLMSHHAHGMPVYPNAPGQPPMHMVPTMVDPRHHAGRGYHPISQSKASTPKSTKGSSQNPKPITFVLVDESENTRKYRFRCPIIECPNNQVPVVTPWLMKTSNKFRCTSTHCKARKQKNSHTIPAHVMRQHLKKEEEKAKEEAAAANAEAPAEAEDAATNGTAGEEDKEAATAKTDDLTKAAAGEDVSDDTPTAAPAEVKAEDAATDPAAMNVVPSVEPSVEAKAEDATTDTAAMDVESKPEDATTNTAAVEVVPEDKQPMEPSVEAKAEDAATSAGAMDMVSDPTSEDKPPSDVEAKAEDATTDTAAVEVESKPEDATTDTAAMDVESKPEDATIGIVSDDKEQADVSKQ